MTALTLEMWSKARESFRKDRRRIQLDATCPHCQADLLDGLESAANDWGGYGPPSTRMIECPGCQAEITYDLKWDAILSHTEITDVKRTA